MINTATANQAYGKLSDLNTSLFFLISKKTIKVKSYKSTIIHLNFWSWTRFFFKPIVHAKVCKETWGLWWSNMINHLPSTRSSPTRLYALHIFKPGRQRWSRSCIGIRWWSSNWSRLFRLLLIETFIWLHQIKFVKEDWYLESVIMCTVSKHNSKEWPLS